MGREGVPAPARAQDRGEVSGFGGGGAHPDGGGERRRRRRLQQAEDGGGEAGDRPHVVDSTKVDSVNMGKRSEWMCSDEYSTE